MDRRKLYNQARELHEQNRKYRTAIIKHDFDTLESLESEGYDFSRNNLAETIRLLSEKCSTLDFREFENYLGSGIVSEILEFLIENGANADDRTFSSLRMNGYHLVFDEELYNYACEVEKALQEGLPHEEWFFDEADAYIYENLGERMDNALWEDPIKLLERDYSYRTPYDFNDEFVKYEPKTEDIYYRDIFVAAYLIKKDAVTSTNQKTLLLLKAILGYYDMRPDIDFPLFAWAELLVKCGAEIHTEAESESISPLMAAMALAVINPNGDHPAVLEILIRHDSNINSMDREGYAPLMLAICLRNISLVEMMLEQKNIDVNLRDGKEGFAAIDFAFDDKNIRKLLIQHGAKYNKLDLEQKKIISKKTQRIKKIISDFSADYNCRKLIRIPELACLQHGSSPKLIEAEISSSSQHKFDDDKEPKWCPKAREIFKSEKCRSGAVPFLHLACEAGLVDVVKILLKNNKGYSPDEEDQEGLTAWEHASRAENSKEIISLLDKYKCKKLLTRNHSPQSTVKLLSVFTRDTPMKYTTHIWDFGGLKNTYKNFKGFMQEVAKQWKEIEDDLYELSPDLHAKIYNFLLNKDQNENGWLGKDNLSIGWSSLEGLEKWCDEGRDPFNFRLEEPMIIDNDEDISTFGDVINVFKRQIEIRKEDYSTLEEIFIDLEESLPDNFGVNKTKLEGKTFYMDVNAFKDALKNIFSEIEKRDFFNIEINATNTTGEYIDLLIIQKDSLGQQSAKEMLKEVEDGNFAGIKKLLSNLCDWSIESSFEEENFRVNYLRSDRSIPEIEILDYKPEGFTHRLRFYLL